MARNDGDEEQRRPLDPRLIAGGIVGAAAAVFVVQNTEQVRVDWMVWDVGAPLWLVLVLAVICGGILGEALGALRRRRSKR